MEPRVNQASGVTVCGNNCWRRSRSSQAPDRQFTFLIWKYKDDAGSGDSFGFYNDSKRFVWNMRIEICSKGPGLVLADNGIPEPYVLPLQVLEGFSAQEIHFPHPQLQFA